MMVVCAGTLVLEVASVCWLYARPTRTLGHGVGVTWVGARKYLLGYASAVEHVVKLDIC